MKIQRNRRGRFIEIYKKFYSGRGESIITTEGEKTHGWCKVAELICSTLNRQIKWKSENRENNIQNITNHRNMGTFKVTIIRIGGSGLWYAS